MTVSTLSLSSPVVTDPAESRPLREVRRCSVDVVAIGNGGSRCAPSSRSRRWHGQRSSAPLFTAIMWADPAHPPKRHLAHLRCNFLYWSSSPGPACGFSSMRLLPSSPCIVVAWVRRLVQRHLLVLPPFLYTRPQTHITSTNIEINAYLNQCCKLVFSPCLTC